MYFYALHGQLTADYVPTRCHRMAVLAYCVATVVFAPSPLRTLTKREARWTKILRSLSITETFQES